MNKILIGDIIELVVSIITLIFFALFSILVITPVKYIFFLGSIYASINTAQMWENISNYQKYRKNLDN